MRRVFLLHARLGFPASLRGKCAWSRMRACEWRKGEGGGEGGGPEDYIGDRKSLFKIPRGRMCYLTRFQNRCLINVAEYSSVPCFVKFRGSISLIGMVVCMKRRFVHWCGCRLLFSTHCRLPDANRFLSSLQTITNYFLCI